MEYPFKTVDTILIKIIPISVVLKLCTTKIMIIKRITQSRKEGKHRLIFEEVGSISSIGRSGTSRAKLTVREEVIKYVTVSQKVNVRR